MLITWHLESSIVWFQPQTCLLPVPVSLTSTLNLDFWLGPTLRVGGNPVKAGSTQGEKLNGAVRGVYHKKCRLERWARKSVQLLTHVWLIAAPWTAAHQPSLSITNSWRLLKLMSIESVMPSNHLVFCFPLLLLPSIFPSIRVFSNESVLCIRWPKVLEYQLQHQPFNKYSGLISFMMDWISLQSEGLSRVFSNSSKASVLQCSAFFTVQLSHPKMTTGKTIALTSQIFVSKVMSAF